MRFGYLPGAADSCTDSCSDACHDGAGDEPLPAVCLPCLMHRLPCLSPSTKPAPAYCLCRSSGHASTVFTRDDPYLDNKPGVRHGWPRCLPTPDIPVIVTVSLVPDYLALSLRHPAIFYSNSRIAIPASRLAKHYWSGRLFRYLPLLDASGLLAFHDGNAGIAQLNLYQ